MAQYYPIFMDIQGRRCLVVGGGEVAERKVNSLLECGAKVRVVSPRLTGGLQDLRGAGKIEVLSRGFEDGDTRGMALVIAATDNPDLNGRIYREAAAANVPVNVVDDPQFCSFIVPSVFRRGGVAVAISTGGRSPALARRIRVALEERFPKELGDLAELLADVRQGIKESGERVDGDTWQKALDFDALLQLLREGKRDEARARVVAGLKK